jgi:FkbM family methyltransferase
MTFHLFTNIFRLNNRSLLFVLVTLIFGIIYYFKDFAITTTISTFPGGKTIVSQATSLHNHLNIIDLQENSKQNITCIKTKYLLHIVRTTICVHDSKELVSNTVLQNKIWDEAYLIQLLSFLIRYPQMSFIDAGANIGTYTMFAASFGRFVLAIECFKPNIDRIRKAVQIEKVEDRIVLVGNAIFSESGKYLQMESDPLNIGSQGIIVNNSMNQSTNKNYTVKTMRFDDILPILKEKKIRNAIMKVDIQWSEVFLCETGNETFDHMNIPLVFMEWFAVPHYNDRMRKVLKFFIGRGYVPTSDMCNVLNESDAFQSWPWDIYWMKMNRSEIC